MKFFRVDHNIGFKKLKSAQFLYSPNKIDFTLKGKSVRMSRYQKTLNCCNGKEFSSIKRKIQMTKFIYLIVQFFYVKYKLYD